METMGKRAQNGRPTCFRSSSSFLCNGPHHPDHLHSGDGTHGDPLFLPSSYG